MQLSMFTQNDGKQTKNAPKNVKRKETTKKNSSQKVIKDSSSRSQISKPFETFCRKHLVSRKSKKHKEDKNKKYAGDDCTQEVHIDIGGNDRRFRKYKNGECATLNGGEPKYHPYPAHGQSAEPIISVLRDQHNCLSSSQTINCNTLEKTDVHVESTQSQTLFNICCDKYLPNQLHDERCRLATFLNYPVTCTKSAVSLANSGFVYSGTGLKGDDSVICVFCGVRIRDWRFQDDVQEVHKERSPRCVMVLDSKHSHNISITSSRIKFLKFDLILQELDSHRNLVEFDAKPTEQEEFHSQVHRTTNHNCSSSCSIPQCPQLVQEINYQSEITSFTTSDIYSSEIISNYTTSAITSHSRLNTTLSSYEINSSPQISSHREASPVSPLLVPPLSVTTSTLSASITSQSPHTSLQVSQSQASPLHSTSQVEVSSQSQPRPCESDAIVSDNPANTTTITLTATTSPNTHENSSTNRNTTPPTTTSQPTSASQSNRNTPPPTTTSQPTSASQSNRNTPSYTELGIITERPKRTEFAIKSERLKSYSSWPQGHFLVPADLADAGFYFAGYGDCARCFYCGGGLRNWDDDDVWVEHARWFPKCAFIRNKMGQAFVDAVSELNKTQEKISFEMVVNEMGTLNFDSNLDPRNNPLKRDPAVKTVIDLGYKETDVIELAHKLKENDVVLSADILLEKLKDEGKMHNEHLLNFETSTISPLDIETTRQMKEKNNQLRQQTVCKICLENEVAVVFLPCGHLVSCTECSSAVRNCPMCRAPVKGIVRAFLN